MNVSSSSEENTKMKIKKYDGTDIDFWTKRLKICASGKGIKDPMQYGNITGRDRYIKHMERNIDYKAIANEAMEEAKLMYKDKIYVQCTEEERLRCGTSEEAQKLETQYQLKNDELIREKIIEERDRRMQSKINFEKQVLEEKWEKKNNKAMDLIMSSIERKYQELIIQTEDPREALMMLRQDFEKAKPQNISTLANKLNGLKLADVNDVAEYVRRFRELNRQLTELGHVTSEQVMTENLLRGLTKPYAMWVEAIRNGPAYDFNEVSAKLKAKEAQLLNEGVIKGKKSKKKKKDERIEALTAQVSALYALTKKDNEKKKDKKKDKCNYCGKPGHYARECRKKKAELNKKNVQANVATTDNEEKEEDEEVTVLCTEVVSTNNATCSDTQTDTWVADSGCQRTMVNNRKWLIDIKPCIPVRVKGATGETTIASEVGTAVLRTEDKKGKQIMKRIDDVLLVPGLTYNLLSLSKMMIKKRTVITFKGKDCIITRRGREIIRATLHEGLYKLMNTSYIGVVDTSNADKSERWHCRLGHVGYSILNKMVHDNLVEGIEEKEIYKPKDHLCRGCLLGKSTRKVFTRSDSRSKKFGELTHMDLSGKSNLPTWDYQFYYAVFLDDASNMGRTFLSPMKKGIINMLKEYKKSIEASGGKMRIIRCDGGKEYINREIKKYCQDNGIEIQMTTPDTPQSNGKAERYIRTITEMARSMLKASRLDQKFWGEAILTATYIRNRVPSSTLDNKKTPFEMVYRKKPKVKHLRIWGSKCYIHNTSDKKKWDDRSRPGIMMGYAIGQKAYRIYDINNDKVISSRDVTFEENVNNKIPSNEKIGKEEIETGLEMLEESYTETNAFLSQYNFDHKWRIPETYQEAMNSDARTEWKMAMDKEYGSLMRNDTWEVVKVPKGRKVMKSGWVFAIKFHADGKLERYKARFVGKGYSQIYGVDFTEVFAPVVQFTTARMVILWAASKGYHIHQMDIETAFLNGKMDTEVYVAQPKGYEIMDPKEYACRLNKSLYGTRQGARMWYISLHTHLTKRGFKRSKDDYCLYYKNEGTNILIILVYVDDIIILASSIESMTKAKKEFEKEFKMKDMGELRYFVGMQINYNRNKREISIHQKGYAEKALITFNMSDCKGTLIPMNNQNDLIPTDEDEKFKDVTLYRKLIGTLIYAVTCTRPDLAYSVSKLAKYMQNPLQKHFMAAKRVLRYIAKTKDYGLRYKSKGKPKIEVYCDASWADDKDNRKSTMGYVITFGGTPISWKTKSMKTVALSSTEAEWASLANVLREVIWIKRILIELGIMDQSDIIKVHEDNQGCIKLSRNPVMHERTKHIDIAFCFIREMVERGEIDIVYCDTKEMVADMMTKPLNGNMLTKFVGMLKMKDE